MKHLLPLLLLLFPQDKEIRLLVRVDDMGVSQSVNEACIRTCKEGIARSVEVIVPGPWFLDAVRRLNENPEIDVGIHLCLTSEWERVKWRPLTASPSLADKDGYFYPMTRQRKDFPPGTGLYDANPKPEEIERELRAQIELLRRHVPRLSHASAHMGAATATPEARAVTEKLCKEFGLRLETKGLKRVRDWTGSKRTAEEKESGLVAAVEAMEPGTYLIVEHPGLDTEEMRAMGHKGYENVAADRAGVTRAFTSDKVKQAIKDKGVKLISHLDLPKDQ
jgi:chitin disaccharide deacetylase